MKNYYKIKNKYFEINYNRDNNIFSFFTFLLNIKNN